MTEREILLTILFVLATVALVIVVFKFLRLKSELPTRVREQYEAFRNSELQALNQQYQQIAQKEATVQFEQWASAKEEEIRKDAINRSRVVTIGKVSEQVVPFHPEFSYNPKDARFIGSPVDFVVFDGLDDKELRKVVFIEVKTGHATLTRREKQIREAIDQHLVEFKVLSISPATQHSSIGATWNNPTAALSPNLATPPAPVVTQFSNPRAHLIAVDQIDRIPKDFSLVKDEISIGRSENNDIVIPHPSVSRMHARLMRRDGAYELTDLGSFNGSFVGNQRVSGPTIIANGSEVRFGNIRFTMRF